MANSCSKSIGENKQTIELFASWVIFQAFLSYADFFKINFLEKFFQEYHQSAK